MDEPCSALDADGIERIEELISERRSIYLLLSLQYTSRVLVTSAFICA